MATRAAVPMVQQRRTRLVPRNREDDRVPAFRLPVPKCVPAVDPPGSTEKLPDPADIVVLEPITVKPLTPFLSRESSCEFLEYGDRDRRCLAGDDAQSVPLRQQAAYCLGPGHQRCGEYRTARGLRRIPPERLAVYSVVIAVMLALVIIAGIQTIQSDSGSAVGQSGVVVEQGR